MSDKTTARDFSSGRNESRAELAPPAIPDHELLRCIGRGSYGQVWLARNIMGTYRAVKIVYRHSFEDSRPFDREFRGIQRFEPISRAHTSQVDILHVGQTTDCFFYVMELADDANGETGRVGMSENAQQELPGDADPQSPIETPALNPDTYQPKTLKSELDRQGHLPFVQCLEIALSLTTALQHLHEHGLIHRDIKPANIIFVNGIPKLADIGLVTGVEASISCVGTEGFLPPEGSGTPPADIFSLGKVLYEMSTGKDRQEFPDPPTRLGEFADRKELLELDEIVQKACARDPDQRYQTARDMHEELLLLKAGKSIRRTHLLERRFTVVTRIGAVAAAIALLAVAGYFASVKQAQRAQRAEQKALEALHLVELQRAEDLFAKDDSGGALALLARLLRENPADRVAAERLLAALTCRSFAIPVMPPFQHGAKIRYAALSPDGLRAVTTGDNGVARVWDTKTGQVTEAPLTHTGRVNFAEFSADSQRVLTASDDFTARVWDAQTGRAITPPLRHGSNVTAAHFSPNARQVVTASDDGTGRIWDAQTGAALSPPLEHSQRVLCAEFSPDGLKVLTAGHGVRVWDAQTAELIKSHPTHGSLIGAAHFSPDGQWVATASWDWTAQVRATETGALRFGPLRHEDKVFSLAFSPDGSKLVTATEGWLRLWDAATGSPLADGIKHYQVSVSRLHFSPDGQWIATAADDARVWDAHTGEPLTEPLRHQFRVSALSFGRDGQRLLTASTDGTAQIWDIRPGGALDEPLRHGATVWFARFSPDGKRIATASSDYTARVWDEQTRLPVTPEPLQHQKRVRSIYFSPDGQRVVTTSDDHTARVWSVATGAPLTPELRHTDIVLCAQFSPDGDWIVTAANDSTARVWNARTGQPRGPSLRHDSAVRLALFDSDGSRVLTGCQDGTTRIWDVRTGQPLTPALKPDQTIQPSQFSLDGQQLFTSVFGPSVAVWDGATGRFLLTPLLSEGHHYLARLSPDGRRIMTAADKVARVWDLGTEPLRHVRNRANPPIGYVHFTRDGVRVATGRAEPTAAAWDISNGRALSEPLHHKEKLYSAEFSPDGRWLLTSANDDTARIREVPPAELPVPDWLPALAEAVAGRRFNQQRVIEPVPSAELWKLQQRLKQQPVTGPSGRWANWFFADRSTRTISPHSFITVPDYVQRRVAENWSESLRQALRLEPTNVEARRRLDARLRARNRL